MILEINTETLKNIGITADDFLYLYLLHSRDYKLVNELNLKPNTKAFPTKRLVNLRESLKDHIIRQEV